MGKSFDHVMNIARDINENYILDESVSTSQLKQLEKYLDSLFKELDIDVEFTRHFLERVNDERNKDEPITVAQLRDVFRENFRTNQDKLKGLRDKEDAHFLKVSNRLNIPFTFVKDKNGDLELVAKTVVRRSEDWVKRGKPSDGGKIFKVK
jgi:hypothetical protein